MPKLPSRYDDGLADLKKRLYNRCNKEMERIIVNEPRCRRCGCPEFRWQIKIPTGEYLRTLT